ncbi:MAG: glycerol-3-phosphate acyltransferase [Caldisericota bacterium]|nr:glycerol-3-phosphate acyltransferase [Caldisericota bacterium]
MNSGLYIALILVSYLIGAVNFAIIFTSVKLNIDIRNLGDHNPGATNVYFNVDKRLGVLVGILDGLKGFIPLVFARRIGAPSVILLIIGAAAILGHDYPVFYHFNGGSGISTTAGVALFFAPKESLMILLFAAVIIYSLHFLKNKRTGSFSLLEIGEAIVYICFLLCIFAPNILNLTKMFYFLAVLIVVIRRFDKVKQLLSRDNIDYNQEQSI